MNSVGSNLREFLALRVRKYIDMVSRALRDIERIKGSIRGSAAEVVELARMYRDDALYYLRKGDVGTALACVSYAEGLIDALRIQGIINISWKRGEVKKVLVAGTFDILHPGHISYLREADKLGLVYAVVGRDDNVRRLKGRSPILPESSRLEVVSAIKYVYKAILGDKEDMLKPVEIIRPDVIFLGPDQPMDEYTLKKRLEGRGVKAEVIRMSRRISSKPSSTTEVLKEVLRRYCVKWVEL